MEIKIMKKAYVKPTMENESFVPNQFIAACKNPSSYVGYCDISGRVYMDTNGNGQYDEGIDKYKYTNTACNRMYESDEMPTFNAFVVEKNKTPGYWEGPLLGGHWVPGKTEVVVTPVFNYNDVHVTQHIDQTKHYNVSI